VPDETLSSVNEYDFGSVVVPEPATYPIFSNSLSKDLRSISNPWLLISVAVVHSSKTEFCLAVTINEVSSTGIHHLLF